ncbi:hypothetical protein [Mycobacterium avium]|uniref:hypothetical protein n=1 Tax=Mycobacterium avium TaxID=1764 RepID=UPI000A4FDF8E|nr:hypothetical protein [Mycobacterium avium]MDV3215255.1 hypothetical protein [Mycobacterium avium]
MTAPDKLTVLRAAIEICDDNNDAATAQAVANRLGVEKELMVLKLLPAIANYFEKVSRGDDGVVVVREPTAEARRFVGS